MRADKWRKLRKSPAWPFIAMAAAGHYTGRHAGGRNWDDWPGWGGGMGGGPRRGGRRRRMFGSGELRLVLLKLIADEPRHGYELIKALEDLTGGEYSPSPGTIYPTLSLLEDEGAIAQAAGDDTRKAYEASAQGRAELEERAEEVSAIMDRLAAHGESRKPFATPEMFRAAGNLAGVLKNKARSGQLDEATMHEIVDLIDELAKKIERL